MERIAANTNNKSSSSPKEIEADDHLWLQRHEALYRSELSTLYHRKRERFFVLADRWSKALAVIFGSTAWARIGGEGGVMVSAAVVTVSGALSLVFGFSERARVHSEKAGDYKRVEAEILRVGERDLSDATVASWLARLRELEAGEPPTLSALVVLCQNEIAAAAGQRDKIIKMSLTKRIGAHFFDFMPD